MSARLALAGFVALLAGAGITEQESAYLGEAPSAFGAAMLMIAFVLRLGGLLALAAAAGWFVFQRFAQP